MRKIIVITIQRIPPSMTAISLSSMEITLRLRESMTILLCKKQSWDLSKTVFESFLTGIPTSQYGRCTGH